MDKGIIIKSSLELHVHDLLVARLLFDRELILHSNLGE